MVDPEPILDTAKYLRNVRPIDPDAVQEYVDQHPGVIRQVLREYAYDLGLVQQADGTFVPVPEGHPPVPSTPVTELPRRYVDQIEELLIERFGPDWQTGATGTRLRERIDVIKDRYYRGQSIDYDDLTVYSYLLYHFPGYYAAIQYLLRDLVADGHVGHSLRVLDVGAGTGGPAMGLIDALPADAWIEYHAVEPSAPAVSVFESMLSLAGPNVTPHTTTAPVETASLPSEADLIVCANVLSELEDPAAAMRRVLDALAEDGTLLLMAPADRNTTETLRRVERALADDGPATVYAPTLRLWPGERPTDDGWSFVRQPSLTAVPVQEKLQAAAEHPGGATYTNTTVQYAYSRLRCDGRRRIENDPDPASWAKLATSPDHVGNRIDVLVVKLSDNLAAEGNPLYRIADGSQSVAHFAVLVAETALNDALSAAEYGDLLRIEAGLLLWNDDETAYNLVVDDETVVDAVPL